MKITKYGHACLFVEEKNARILIDPGVYCFMDGEIKPKDIPKCNVLIITHNHQDHVDIDALKIILQKSKPIILTTEGVQEVLEESGINSEIIKPREIRIEYEVSIKGIGGDHGFIASHVARPKNIGVLIADRLYHPGDCIYPAEEVKCEILAVPVSAPWMAINEGLEFVKKIHPFFIIPIHDAIVKYPESPWYRIFETGLTGTGIEFIRMNNGVIKEF